MWFDKLTTNVTQFTVQFWWYHRLHFNAALVHSDDFHHQPEELLPFLEGHVLQPLTYPGAKLT
jgi:hypothetical protein